MSVGMKQTLNLSQTLRMTPQLQQAIKLLQLSRIELETAVRKELEENPVLEEGQEELASNNDSMESVQESASEADQDPQKQDEFDWENYFESSQKPSLGPAGLGEEIQNYENIMTQSETIHEHLMWQVKNSGFSEEEQVWLEILVGFVNDDGYIKIDLDQIAEESGEKEEDLLDMLPFLQEFDPPGVGARNLKECLLIQAKHLQEDTHDLIAVIEHHLPDLERKNYEGIAKVLGKDIEDIIEITKIIYSMDPKPGRQFNQNDTHYVMPDVFVYKVGDDYMVSLNEDGLPRLKISQFYKNMLQSKTQTGQTQEYVQEKLRSALWLIKSIHQRQRTIYKVTESIVKYQREFFEKGSGYIKPMILKDIAQDIGMHESTVSRVTTAKYVHTPQGIFELKYFFNSGITKEGGDSLASESVKLKIKAFVDAEDPKKPLSDQKLVALLKKEGIKIARRTVAKYREVLKILPSSRRKKYF